MVSISNSLSHLSNYKNVSNANFGSFEKPLMNILCFMKCNLPFNYIFTVDILLVSVIDKSFLSLFGNTALPWKLSFPFHDKNNKTFLNT